MPVSLFFHNFEPNLAQILPPKDHTHFAFFADFQYNILGDSIILITCVAIQ